MNWLLTNSSLPAVAVTIPVNVYSCESWIEMLLIRFPIFCLLATLSSSIRRHTTCHACVNRVCYSRDTILKASKFSGQLAIDRTSNIVYFHYQKQARDFTGAFNLDQTLFQVIPNLGFTFAKSVDQRTRDLYVSGVTGIYKYNHIKNSTELYGLKDKTIWQMQYTDKLYYNEFKQKGIYTFINKKSTLIPGTTFEIDDFVIDKNNDTYFMSDYTIYLLKYAAKNADVFENEIYSMATDKNGEVYFSQPYTRGIYKIDYRTGKLVEVGAFRGTVVKFVFDSDNHIIYYDDSDRIYYLSPTSNRCTVNTKGVGKKSKMFFALINNREMKRAKDIKKLDNLKKAQTNEHVK